MPIRLSLLAVIASSLFLATCGRPVPGTGAGVRDARCRTDAACIAGELCQSGTCVLASLCDDGDDCGLDQTCSEVSPGIRRCRATAGECDGGCDEGERCGGNPPRCIVEQPDCIADSDCGAGRRCDSGNCVLQDTGCLTDEDCDDGEAPRCYLDERRCVQCVVDIDCDRDQSCRDQRCVDDDLPPDEECQRDGDCPDGRPVCKNAVCVECENNGNCGPCSVCSDGECIAQPAGCVSDDDCNRGQSCDVAACGICVDDPECIDDNDCVDGQICEDGLCNLVDVECRRDGDCEDGAACVEGRCVVGCRSDDQCRGDARICHPDLRLCVQCLEGSDCDSGLCDGGRFICIDGCDPDFPASCPDDQVCAADIGECVDCLEDSDCRSGVCLRNERVCAECRFDSDCNEGERCDDFSCEPDGQGGAGLCEPCDGDEDCGGERDLCIRLSAQGQVIESVCGIDCSDDPTCPGGFICVEVADRGRQCFPENAEPVSTCAGVRDMLDQKECSALPGEGDMCGIDGLPDASCLNYSFRDAQQRCTVVCRSDGDCPDDFECVDIDGGGFREPRCVPR